MSEEKKIPSVIRFEQAVKAKDYELACTEMLSILGKIDTNFGLIHDIECDYPAALANLEKDRIIHFSTRMAVAITALFTDPNLTISTSGVQRFLTSQRWIALLFASSPYINADHILQTYNRNPERENPDEIFLENTSNALYKFCIMYLPESRISLNFEALWNMDPKLCASLCFALQSPRFIGTDAAFHKRSVILQWFPEKLAQLENLNGIPANISHDVYMHCSYDIAENKHAVKKPLNQLIRRHLLNMGWTDRNISEVGYKNGKPVMVVMLEHFHSSHSIYRTHSTSLLAAREKFHVVGFGHTSVDQSGKEVFDEYHEITSSSIMDKLIQVKNICDELKPAVFYMPSIGMDLSTIFASNTRLAPIQAVALGHPATTHSEFIDYVIVEDDYVGSENCFSEKLLRLPKDALPYVPSALAPSDVKYHLRENPEVVQIAIAATTMKLNPYFLKALQAIRDRAKVKTHFHFLVGQSLGITHPAVERFIKGYLGDSATVHPHTPYHQYLTIMHQCDMVLNPFPFGNTNGIIDMVTLGLVGVCKTGAEVHEHIDEGLFKRLGLPEWLIANTVDDYVERTLRLAENHQERLALRRHIIENNGLNKLFTGNPKPMGDTFLAKLREWAVTHNITLQEVGVEVEVEVEAKTKKKPTKRVTTKKSAKSTDSETKKVAPKKTTAKKSTAKKDTAKKTTTKSAKTAK